MTGSTTFIDLFCGAGGMSLGFEAGGFECQLAVDFDKAAVETHNRNLGEVAICDDVSVLGELPPADVIVGGPPCQGFSSAGSRRTGDNRNSLVQVFAEQVVKSRPRIFVFENVEGFLTAEKGERVLDLLRPVIAAGYWVHLRKLNAANYGVPQHRKRVIAIGALGWAPGFPPPTHRAFGAPGTERLPGHYPSTPTVGDAILDLPPAHKEPPGFPSGHYGSELTGFDLERVQALKPGQTMKDLPEELWHESYSRRAHRRVKDGTPSEKRGGPPAGKRRLHPDEPSKAITGGTRGEFIHPVEQRYLTLRECAKLQTFPDDFDCEGGVTKRAQLIGNAVPPRLALHLARAVKAALQDAPKVTGEPEGQLLSFVPTHANAMSPALTRTTDKVKDMFVHDPRAEQVELWH